MNFNEKGYTGNVMINIFWVTKVKKYFKINYI